MGIWAPSAFGALDGDPRAKLGSWAPGAFGAKGSRGPKGPKGRLRRPWGEWAYGALWGYSEAISNGM